jgi:hypothetical protein
MSLDFSRYSLHRPTCAYVSTSTFITSDDCFIYREVLNKYYEISHSQSRSFCLPLVQDSCPYLDRCGVRVAPICGAGALDNGHVAIPSMNKSLSLAFGVWRMELSVWSIDGRLLGGSMMCKCIYVGIKERHY